MADIELVIKIPEDEYNDLTQTRKNTINLSVLLDLREAVRNGTLIPKGHGRKFESIMVEYPPAELCTYPEYKGKPYFSIKYEENGEHFIGFGTYNPTVLSMYLQEYFIAPTIIEADKAESEDRE